MTSRQIEEQWEQARTYREHLSTIEFELLLLEWYIHDAR